MKKRALIALTGLIIILMGCDDSFLDSYNSEDGDFSSLAEQSKVETPSLPENCSLFSTTGVHDLGNNTCFRIPQGTVSFLLSASDSTNTNAVGFTQLKNPKNIALLETGVYKGRTTVDVGYGNVLLPMSTFFGAIEGNWYFESQNSIGKNQLTLRMGDLSSPTEITVQPYMTDRTRSSDEIQPALAKLKTIYENVGITIIQNPVVTISDARFTSVDPSFTDSDTSALLARGSSEVVNLYFINDFSGLNADLLGIAPGIPGSLGLTGSYNGVLIGITAHSTGNTLDQNLLGETAAHEMAHFLGLFHTTEKYGKVFDPLSDTPECTTSNDTNHNSTMSAEECVGKGGDNLMFWASSPTISQETLTEDQKTIIKNTPLGR